MEFSLLASRARRRAAGSVWPVSVRVWAMLTAVVVVAYLLLTLGIMFRSPVLTFDGYLAGLDLLHQHHDLKPYIFYYVMLGQRGPATLAFLPFFFWVAWRDRTSRPLVMLLTSLILLNISVGIVKLATGRLGPRQSSNTHDLFVGGNIYPSGHVSNTVVLYGVIALLVVNRRKLAAFGAAFLSVTVGLGTVWLGTHWFSDVVGGWLAGALVLLALPVVMPTAQRWSDRLVARIRRRFGRSPNDENPGRGDGRARSPGAGVRTVRILGSAELGSANHHQSENVTPVRSDA